jgi:hypothetical protein
MAAVVGHGVLVAITVGVAVGCALTAGVVVAAVVIRDGDDGLSALPRCRLRYACGTPNIRRAAL